MNGAEIHAEMVRLSVQLDKALALLRTQVHEYADSEDAYRMALAKAYLSAEGPAHARKYIADAATSEERRRAHLADGMRQAALEAVRSRRAQLSALQSAAAGYRAEAEFSRTGPE